MSQSVVLYATFYAMNVVIMKLQTITFNLQFRCGDDETRFAQGRENVHSHFNNARWNFPWLKGANVERMVGRAFLRRLMDDISVITKLKAIL